MRATTRWIGLVIAAILANACSPASSSTPPAEPARAPVPQHPIEDFMATTRIGGGWFSPDGNKLLFHSNQTGVFNLFAIPVAGGQPTQLTQSTDNAVFSLGYFPKDERLLYSSDRGGNELTHIYVRERDGSIRDLTPGDKVRASFAGWAADDESFFVETNERDPRFMDLYEYASTGYARTLLLRNDEGLTLGPISRDKRYVALVKSRTSNDSDVYVFDRQTRQTKNITTHTGDVANAPAVFAPDSGSLLITTDAGREFAYLVRYTLATGQTSDVMKLDWDVAGAGFSKSGKYMTVAVNNDARTELRVLDAATMKPVPLEVGSDSNVNAARFSADERRMALLVNDSRTPTDLFVADVGGAPQRLTTSLNPKIDRDHLVTAQVVRFASGDAVQIPGILYRPHSATAQAKAPALVMVHGGPGGQARLGYNPIAQYLANHGYVVYDINNRGSSGYGKTFYAMDDRRHGEADLADVVASKRMLADLGYVDGERIGIIGGSYGGYMVLAALAFQPGVFDVGVDIFGVANWVRTLKSIPSWWTAERDALYAELGDPATDEARLRRISPLFHADKITTPLIVLQGANDPRVLQVESDEMVAAVRKNKVPVEYIVFPDEGHGFVKRENEIRGYRAVLDFLDRHLKAGFSKSS
jgi:dipeptidyl aminopeptidase/acylaminoacyl peptidase